VNCSVIQSTGASQDTCIFLKLPQMLKVTVLHLGSENCFLHYKVERKQSNISSMSGNGGKIKNSIVFQSLTNQMTNCTLTHEVSKCYIPGVRFSNNLWFSPPFLVSQAGSELLALHRQVAWTVAQ